MHRPHASKDSSEFSVPIAVPAEAAPKSDGKLVIKGLYVGMDGDEAIKTIMEAAEGNIGTRPTSDPGAKGVDLLFHDPRWKSDAKQYAGGIHIDAKEGYVREFYFLGPLADYLFKTNDLTPEEFAQKFINAYNVPSLHVVTFQGKREWRYESPRGWSLAITQQKQVNVWMTTAPSFN
ncbi:MAG: hypothetical protein ACAI37_20365 [Chthoniobacter sp.]